MEEILRHLWDLNEDSASELSVGVGLQVVSSSLTSGYGSTSGSPRLKTFFRQKFDPKEITIAVFITIYNAIMRRATEEQKGLYPQLS